MNKYLDGQHVWWLSRSNTPLFFACAIQSATIEKIEESEFLTIRNGAGCLTTVPPDDVFPTKKDALNAAIRKFQEALFND